ncbi:MAG: N-acetylmuramoyl-L-alanine amidase [Rikenellaceae bacterium]
MKTKLFFYTLSLLALLLTPNANTSAVIAQGVKVIVIDPGHGGNFPGASYKGVEEKTVVLSVAKRLGALINKRNPDIKVVYTRTTDKHLSTNLKTDLGMRSKIASEAGGDLFISIHANAASSTAAYGAETIIMGESTLEQSRNDAALYEANREDLLDMSDDKTAAIVRAHIQNLQYTYGEYSEALARQIQIGYGKYGRKLRALRRQPIMVLYGTDMPCVLTEIGFLSNDKERAYLNSASGQQEVAESIYSGISAYIQMVNKTTAAQNAAPQPTSGYAIQILSSAKILNQGDKQFKSYRNKVWHKVVEGRFKYKYCIGKYATRAEAERALKGVKHEFKDAFVVTY